VRFNVSREDAEFPASHEPKSVPEIPRLSVRALLQARKRIEHAVDGLADLHVSSFSAYSRDSEHNQVTRNACQDAKFAPSQPKSKPISQRGPVHGGSSASSLNWTDMAENSKASDIEDYSVIPPPSSQFLDSLISLLKARWLWIVAECNLGKCKNCTWTCFIAGYSSWGFFSGFSRALINQLHQLALLFTWKHLRKATPVLRMICYYYCFEQFENTLFCNSSSCCGHDSGIELHWTTFVMHACDQEVLLLLRNFCNICSIKTQTDPQFETDRNMQECTNPHQRLKMMATEMNSWILHSQCAHNYQSYDILSPLFRPTHIMWALWEHCGNVMWTLWEHDESFMVMSLEHGSSIMQTWRKKHGTNLLCNA
jgi:hypothetical protein